MAYSADNASATVLGESSISTLLRPPVNSRNGPGMWNVNATISLFFELACSSQTISFLRMSNGNLHEAFAANCSKRPGSPRSVCKQRAVVHPGSFANFSRRPWNQKSVRFVYPDRYQLDPMGPRSWRHAKQFRTLPFAASHVRVAPRKRRRSAFDRHAIGHRTYSEIHPTQPARYTRSPGREDV